MTARQIADSREIELLRSTIPDYPPSRLIRAHEPQSARVVASGRTETAVWAVWSDSLDEDSHQFGEECLHVASSHYCDFTGSVRLPGHHLPDSDLTVGGSTGPLGVFIMGRALPAATLVRVQLTGGATYEVPVQQVPRSRFGWYGLWVDIEDVANLDEPVSHVEALDAGGKVIARVDR